MENSIPRGESGIGRLVMMFLIIAIVTIRYSEEKCAEYRSELYLISDIQGMGLQWAS